MTKASSALYPRLQQVVKCHFIAVLHEHVVEQDAVVGLLDAQELLHGERGQAHLAAADPGTLPTCRSMFSD